MRDIDVKSVNSIRVLAAEAIEKAKSGHPGLPLGSAPMAYELWSKHMKINPADPNWADRDRFILSGGHGSALLYSLLYMFGYGLTMEDMKQFRQLGSLTPGHPEYGHTVGVEATTGPLGAGIAMAVGMAMAEKHLAAVFNKDGYNVVDHYTFALGGDGSMMEGISYEACSLAGSLGLDKLIILYDSNNITIEGDTNIAFKEDVRKRFESFGFHTQLVEDGNDLDAIGAAIEAAKAEKSKPSLIEIKTKIGAGCPAKEGKASAHGEPLGAENVEALKDNLGLGGQEPFTVADDVQANFAELKKGFAAAEDEWNKLFAEYCDKYPDMKELWDTYHDSDNAKKLYDMDDFWNMFDKPEATRNVSGKLLNLIKDVVPNMFGGAADLAPSTKTYMNGAGDFSAETPEGSNLHFGIRELAMAAMGNGMALHGGVRPYVSTFFVFSDYVKPMARLSALMGLPLTYVFTHDSIGVGEDGPTHEPIEQLAMLRALPNFFAFRPADGKECAAAWYFALNEKKAPTALILSRQNLPQLDGSGVDALKGGYILQDSEKSVPDAIIIASGSEVQLAVEAKERMKSEGVDIRVVSMPCLDEFKRQPEEYKESVLPKAVRARVGVEALSSFGWGELIGLDGEFVGMKGFGASGPGGKIFDYFGINTDAVVEAVKKVLK
ncbi:MAG: transketolase [Lachnospiraceae bacterium]|nr:transketolase [Lachnospiraceae bacterium]